jgi:serine/threonine protein kinase
MPPPPRWELIKRLFLEAQALPVPQQQELLESCPPDIRNELRGLLASDRTEVLSEAPSPSLFLDAINFRQESPSRGSTQRTAETVGYSEDEAHLAAEVAKEAADGALTQPTRLGDYEILQLIGKGGMGEVYLAQQTSLDRKVAVKTIRASVLSTERAAERFYREATAAAQLEHPGIVPVYEVAQSQGVHFYSMAHIDGPNLAELLRDRGHPLPAVDAARIVGEIAKAVQHAHENGVLHRDLKPANILIDERGQPRVTDFGLAKFEMSSDHQSAEEIASALPRVYGTPGFMPPEQALGIEEVGPEADVYSLGALLFRMTTGSTLFAAATLKESIEQLLREDPPLARDRNSSVPEDLSRIIAKCTQRDTQRRYASAAELLSDLQLFVEGKPVRARPVGLTGRGWRWCKREPKLAIMSATALAGLIVFVTTLLLFNRQLRIALDSAVQNHQLAVSVVDDLSQFYADNPKLAQQGQRPIRSQLLLKLTRLYDWLDEHEQGSGDRQGKWSDAQFRLARILENDGQLAAADELYQQVAGGQQKQLDLITPATANSADEDVQRLRKSLSLTLMGRCRTNLALGKLTLADEYLAAAAKLRDQLENEDHYEVSRLTASAQMNRGIMMFNAGEQTKGLELQRLAQETRRALNDRFPDQVVLLRDVGIGAYNLATDLAEHSGVFLGESDIDEPESRVAAELAREALEFLTAAMVQLKGRAIGESELDGDTLRLNHVEAELLVARLSWRVDRDWLVAEGHSQSAIINANHMLRFLELGQISEDAVVRGAIDMTFMYLAQSDAASASDESLQSFQNADKAINIAWNSAEFLGDQERLKDLEELQDLLDKKREQAKLR